MKIKKNLTRREFLGAAGTAAAAAATPAAPPAAPPKSAPAATAAPAATSAPAATAVPTVISGNRTVRVAILASNAQGLKDILAKTDFTKKSGINVEIVNR